MGVYLNPGNRSMLLNSIYSKGYCDHSSCSPDRNSHQKRNQQCRKYYACYSCHDELEDHSFVATTPEEVYPVLCGNCGRKLTLQEYKKGSCPYCHAGFNPKCSLHENIYFCCTM